MNITIDLRSDIPIYLQIVESIRRQIASGELKEGEQLPTVRALASELRINFNTVSRAYRILDEAGIISTRQGRGTYILEMPPPQLASQLRTAEVEALADNFLKQTSRLGYPPEEVIQILRQRSQSAQNNVTERE